MAVHKRLQRVIAPQGPSLVLFNWEYKKPRKRNSSAMGAIIITDIRLKIMGSDNINVIKPSGISIPNIHIYISSRAIKIANNSVPRNTAFALYLMSQGH